MSLRIVLDARRVADFGIGTYIRNLVHSLAKIDTADHYALVTTVPDVPELKDLPANFETVVYQGKNRTGLAQVEYSIFLRSLGADLFHIPLNAVPLWMPKPYLVTIHDMSTLLFSNQSNYRSNVRRFYLRRGLLRADRVMTVSISTRRDVETVLGIPSSRIRVVYNAPDPIFCQASSASWASPNGHQYDTSPEIQRVLDRYRIHYPFLLYVGRTNPQKNIPRLVEAFAVMRGDNTRQSRRKLGAHRHFAVAFVDEIKKLCDNLRTAFFRVEIRRLQHGSVPFHEAVSSCDLPPALEDVIADGAVIWEEIAEAWERLHALFQVGIPFRGVRLSYLIRGRAN